MNKIANENVAIAKRDRLKPPLRQSQNIPSYFFIITPYMTQHRRRMSLVEQELLTLPDHPSVPPLCFVLCFVCLFCFLLFFFWWGPCCSIFSFLCSILWIVVFPFVLFLLVIVLFVILRFTAFDYPFRIFRLLIDKNTFYLVGYLNRIVYSSPGMSRSVKAFNGAVSSIKYQACR